MATVVDIANLALARLGDRANVVSINPPEGSAQADHCARFYPMARDAALAAHDWSFASVQGTLARLEPADLAWEYVFALPNNCLTIREVGYAHDALYPFDSQGPYFELGTLETGEQVIRTNQHTPFVRYTSRVTDPTRFSPLFTEALVSLLASYLAGPVIKGRAGIQAGQVMLQAFQSTLAQASVVDANQSNRRAHYVSSNVRRRGFGHYDRTVELAGGARAELPFWAV